METKDEAIARAKKLNYPLSTVVQSTIGSKGWFIAPLAVTTMAGKRAYANIRAKQETEGKPDKGYAAAIAHTVDDKAKKNHN